MHQTLGAGERLEPDRFEAKLINAAGAGAQHPDAALRR